MNNEVYLWRHYELEQNYSLVQIVYLLIKDKVNPGNNTIEKYTI